MATTWRRENILFLVFKTTLIKTISIMYLGYNCLLRPLCAELLHQLLEVVGGGLSDGVHVVYQPGHAQTVQLLVKELHTELPSQQGHVLYDGQPHAPLGVLRELHNGGQKTLAELLDANNLVDAVQVRDDVQSHVGTLVLQLRQEERQQMLNGVILSKDGGETHDDASKGRLDVLVGVCDQL